MDSYEKRRKELEATNLPLLHGFHGYLIEKRTGKKASCDHIDRLEFFASVYLTDYQDQALEEGYDQVSSYLGDWFIRKAMWSDEDSLKANIGTFRKFYDYLRSVGKIDDTRHAELQSLIRDSKANWFRYLRRYNDPSIDIEDVWDYEDSGTPDPTDKGTTDKEAADENHFVIMLSGRAAKHFKVRSNELSKTDDLKAEGHWTNCWRCEVIAENADSKTTYFLLTNARTLFSIIIPNADRQIKALVSVLSQLLARDVQRINPEIELPQGGSIRLVKGQPRSLIGSQNELIRCALHLLRRPDVSYEFLSSTLNRTPMTALEETFPEDAFKKCLTADPPNSSQPDDTIIPFPTPSKN